MQNLNWAAYTFHIILMYMLTYDDYADIFYLRARGPHYFGWLSIVGPYNIDHYQQAWLYNPPISSVLIFKVKCESKKTIIV